MLVASSCRQKVKSTRTTAGTNSYFVENQDMNLTTLTNALSSSAVQKPCGDITGDVAIPDVGTGMCTGNLLVTIPLSTIGGALVHNSLDAKSDNGFGDGWNFSLRARIELSNSKKTLGLFRGDGAIIYFTATSDAGPWTTLDPRVSRSRFVRSGNDIVQTDLGGDTYIFDRQNANKFNLKSIQYSSGVSYSITASNSQETWTSSLGQSFSFNSSGGKIVSIVDAANHEYSLEYDGKKLNVVTLPDSTLWLILMVGDYIGAIRNPAFERTQFAYWKNGILRAIVDHYNSTTNFRYTSTSVSATSSVKSLVETFNTAKLLKSSKENGLQTDIDRYTSGRVYTERNPYGAITSYTYLNSDVLPATITNKSGTIAIEYNSDTTVKKVTETYGNKSEVQSFTYDNAMRVTAATINGVAVAAPRDARGNITGLVYKGVAAPFSRSFDSRSIPQTTTDNWGQTTTITNQVGATNSTFTFTDPLGRVSTQESDVLGQVKSVVNPDGSTLTRSYDNIGRSTLTKLQMPNVNQSTPGGSVSASSSYAFAESEAVANQASALQVTHRQFFGDNKIAESRTSFATGQEFIRAESRSTIGGLALQEFQVVNVAGNVNSCKPQPSPTFTPATPIGTPVQTPTLVPTPTGTIVTPTPTPTFTPTSSTTQYMTIPFQYWFETNSDSSCHTGVFQCGTFALRKGFADGTVMTNPRIDRSEPASLPPPFDNPGYMLTIYTYRDSDITVKVSSRFATDFRSYGFVIEVFNDRGVSFGRWTTTMAGDGYRGVSIDGLISVPTTSNGGGNNDPTPGEQCFDISMMPSGYCSATSSYCSQWFIYRDFSIVGTINQSSMSSSFSLGSATFSVNGGENGAVLIVPNVSGFNPVLRKDGAVLGSGTYFGHHCIPD